MSTQPQLKQDQPSRSQRKAASGDSMDNRVVRLETRLETLFPNLATKEDIARSEIKTTDAIAGLRSEMKDSINSLIKWIVGTGIALLLAIVSLATFIQNNATPRYLPAAPVQQPAPIIQSAPAPAQPASLAADQERSDQGNP